MASPPLAKCYAFLFVDCMYVTLRENYEAKEYAVYTILGYDLKGNKEILGLWLNQTESKNRWIQVFDELKARGVEDVFSFRWTVFLASKKAQKRSFHR